MAKVNAVPEGMHTLNAHITVKDAAKAIDYYQRAFGAQELSRNAIPGGKLIHASIRIGDSTMYLNDEFPEMGALSPQSVGGASVTLTLYVEDADAVFKKAVDAGADVTMPIGDQFWGDRYGCLKDPFGHLWAIATRKQNLTPEEMERRGREAMAQMYQQR
jgi:uncharacterized glyoxalase superfamily protein PhnB